MDREGEDFRTAGEQHRRAVPLVDIEVEDQNAARVPLGDQPVGGGKT